jgi:RHS repeat-associated protein
VEDLTLQPGENAVVVEATDKAGNETVETFTLFFDPRARATYRYDLNGNLIQKTVRGVVWRYEWDAENRLVRVRKATTEGAESTEIEYAYYDNGNRAWKRVTEPGQEPVVTHYVHDGIHVIAEYNGEGTLLKEYVYSDSIDEVLNIKDGAENFFPHQDGLNSVVAVTDADGERVASYNYEAFGTIKDATGALGNPITYTGRWIEPETGDYFYRARYYDSGIGRFLKRDPIGFGSKDYNFYRYVGNNPIRFFDPIGTLKVTVTFETLGAIVKLLWKYARAWQSLRSIFPKYKSNPFQHCVWNCRMARSRGKSFAKKMSQRKEEIDMAMADLRDSLEEDGHYHTLSSNLKKILEDHADSAEQMSDYLDNATGRNCADKKYEKLSCEECCECQGITRNTPEGPGTSRPFGSRSKYQ